MKPLLVTSGEPAGIGPDLCLALSSSSIPLVVLANKDLLAERAKLLKLDINFIDYEPNKPISNNPNELTVLSIPLKEKVFAGQLNVANAEYVIKMLEMAVKLCLGCEFAALVTAPVHKEIINKAGHPFTGHTEFLKEKTKANKVVMMLACSEMRVALITTHLPLSEVANAISESLIIEIIEEVHQSLVRDFKIAEPTLFVTGLNPHAGEGGYLGREEIDIISPALQKLKKKHIKVIGPLPADTMFSEKNLKEADAFICMYHDQGLPVLKYAGFGRAVNISLGLPIIRTSVDHGTALELAGTGQADTGSLFEALNLAFQMANGRSRDAN